MTVDESFDPQHELEAFDRRNSEAGLLRRYVRGRLRTIHLRLGVAVVGLTLIGRMRGQRFVCLSGEDRLVRDVDPASVAAEDTKHRRKSANG